jgi:hypothetical protein
MHSDSGLRREIYLVRAKRDIVISEENASSNFEEGHRSRGIPLEVVLDIERREAYAVGIPARLGEVINGDRFEFMFYGARSEVEEREADTQPCVEDADITTSASDAVPALCKELEFTRAVGDVLGA